MWIEIDLSITSEDEEDRTEWHVLFNSDNVLYIEPFYSDEHSFVAITMEGKRVEAPMYSEAIAKAVYNALIMALMGQEVILDDWGHIKPLIHEQREALYKYMLYQETVGRMAKDVG